MIAVLDYGIGNLRSAEKALVHVGAEARLVSTAAEADRAVGVVLPGVGNFGACAAALRGSGLDRVVLDAVAQDKPMLGVCVGFQLLYEASEESPGVEGLGVFSGTVARLAGAEKLPQMQWNCLERVPGSGVGAARPVGGAALVLLRPLLRARAQPTRARRPSSRPVTTAGRSSPSWSATIASEPSSTRRSPATPASRFSPPSPSAAVPNWCANPDRGDKPMECIPSIDIRGGQAVRLLRGEFANETAYGDPVTRGAGVRRRRRESPPPRRSRRGAHRPSGQPGDRAQNHPRGVGPGAVWRGGAHDRGRRRALPSGDRTRRRRHGRHRGPGVRAPPRPALSRAGARRARPPAREHRGPHGARARRAGLGGDRPAWSSPPPCAPSRACRSEAWSSPTSRVTGPSRAPTSTAAGTCSARRGSR